MRAASIHIGQKFGRLEVIGLPQSRPQWTNDKTRGRRKISKLWVACRCVCGQEKDVPKHHLLTGISQSCGCLQREDARARRIKGPCVACLNECWTMYRASARARGLPFLLTKDQFYSITSKPCHYCGAPPSNKIVRPRSNGAFTYSGIDRQDNTQGYVFTNCVPCCRQCNVAKSDMTIMEFYDWISHLKNQM
jgi:hypothetical protein